MFSQHTQTFHTDAKTVFNAFATLPSEYKWGDGMLYADSTTKPPSAEGDQRLILRDAETVIEEYTETLVQIDAPNTLALTLTLDDFAMSNSAPAGHLLPDAESLNRARVRIKEGRATNLTLTLTVASQGADSIATLTIATTGQTAPKLGAGLFKRFTSNPSQTLLEWLASRLDAPATLRS